MTPEQIKLVQQSFAKVAPISEQAALLFYRSEERRVGKECSS